MKEVRVKIVSIACHPYTKAHTKGMETVMNNMHKQANPLRVELNNGNVTTPASTKTCRTNKTCCCQLNPHPIVTAPFTRVITHQLVFNMDPTTPSLRWPLRVHHTRFSCVLACFKQIVPCSCLPPKCVSSEIGSDNHSSLSLSLLLLFPHSPHHHDRMSWEASSSSPSCMPLSSMRSFSTLVLFIPQCTKLPPSLRVLLILLHQRNDVG